MAKNKSEKTSFKTSIGGQALIEGILMRGVDKQSKVCRKPDGELAFEVEELSHTKQKYPILGWPFIRGIFMLLSSMANGMKAIKRGMNREARAALLRVRTRPDCPEGNLRELT